MKRYFIIFFGLFLFVFVPQIHAQPQTNTDIRFVCLDAQWCNDDACPSGEQHVHRTALSSKTRKAVPATKTYITECVEVDEGIACTTGNSTLDIELFCGDTTGLNPDQINQCDHLTRLQKSDVKYALDHNPSYGIYHLNQQTQQYDRKSLDDPQGLTLQSDSLGNIIPIEWQSFTEKSRMRKFMMWNKITETSDVPREGVGQKQADLPFIFRSSSCSGNSYDPYGKVFDMMTLEPIPDSQVTLKQLDTATNAELNITIANPNIVNPFFTSSTGHFSFVVVDGNYALSPVSLGYTHATTAESSLLPVNTSRIYSDLYYEDSDVIRQRGKIQHRDVVMKPDNGTGNTFPLEKLDESTEENNGKLIYSGLLSHPFVLLNVEICTPGDTEVCTAYKEFNHRNGGPNKDGEFKVTLDQSALQNGQYFKMKFIKQDLTTATLTQSSTVIDQMIAWVQSVVDRAVEKVNAQTGDTLESKVEPIPVYIEGYAYNNEGNIMSNARVGVYVNFSEAPIYQNSTDINGYFRITSEYIPATEFSLRFTSTEQPDMASYQSTSQFLANNSTFIEAEQINPYKYASTNTNPRRNVTPSFVPEQKISPLVTEVSPTQAVAPTSTEATTTTTTSRNPVYLIGAVLLILLGGAGVMLAIYVYKKRSKEEETPKTE